MKKSQDKKITVKFIIIMLLSMVVGGIIGYFIQSRANTLKSLLLAINTFLQTNASVLLVLNLLFAAASCYFYLKGKRFMLSAAADNEEAFDKADCAYSTALNFATICSSVSLVFFGFGVSAISTTTEPLHFIPIAVSICLFFITLIVTILLQYVIVNATKKLYPEKRGNTLDMKFQKDWFASCDEAEQKQIGECAYTSYKTVSGLIPFLFFGCILINVAFNIGVFPYIIVGIVSLVSSQSYYFTSQKLSKKLFK